MSTAFVEFSSIWFAKYIEALFVAFFVLLIGASCRAEFTPAQQEVIGPGPAL